MVERKWDISPEEMRKFLEPKLTEYFVSGDTTDVVADVCELSRPDINPLVVELILTEAIERTVRTPQPFTSQTAIHARI